VEQHPVEYAERLAVPLRWWVQGTMLVASLWLATAVALPTVASWIVTGAALALMTAMLVGYGSARIRVGDGQLTAGRATIGAEHIGDAAPLDPDATRRLAGPGADARAYLLLRPYLKRAVRVDITDPTDPAPYWLLCTRRPDDLAAALRALTADAAAG
ncbi:MAG: DUF3093 domain-containing protein, partial [Nocardioides sp.]